MICMIIVIAIAIIVIIALAIAGKTPKAMRNTVWYTIAYISSIYSQIIR